jgi:hypothetical protein
MKTLILMLSLIATMLSGPVNANETVDCFYEANKSHPACK